MFNIDLYLLVTQGQYSPKVTEYWTPDGYYIFVEEEEIVVTKKRGGGAFSEPVIKRRITIKIQVEDKNYTKTFILNNKNLYVNNVNFITLDNTIKIELKDVRFENINKIVKIKIED
jgi:hypothetical protein